MKVTAVEKIRDDGFHNAFTDICQWSGRYWVCFRHAVNHISAESTVHVLSSPDGRCWEQAGEIGEPGVDLRDPKWLVTDGRLGLYTYRYGRDVADGRRLQTISFWSDDGVAWTLHEPEPPMNFRIWNPHRVPSGWYAATHEQIREKGVSRYNWVDLIFSPDGRSWSHVSRVVSEGFPSEASVDVADDGTMTVLARREEDGGKPLVCRSTPPYNTWECRQADRFLAGPLMKRLGDRLVVVGRCVLTDRPRSDDDIRTAIFYLEGESLRHVATLPSGKDTSYAGIAPTGPGSAWISYYSGHEFDNGSNRIWKQGSGTRQEPQRTAIYLARVQW